MAFFRGMLSAESTSTPRVTCGMGYSVILLDWNADDLISISRYKVIYQNWIVVLWLHFGWCLSTPLLHHTLTGNTVGISLEVLSSRCAYLISHFTTHVCAGRFQCPSNE